MKQCNCFNGSRYREPSVFFTLIEKEFFMYQFFVGCFVAAFVCGLMLCLSAIAEASTLGSIPDIQCAAPVLVKPIANVVFLLITVAALFL